MNIGILPVTKDHPRRVMTFLLLQYSKAALSLHDPHVGHGRQRGFPGNRTRGFPSLPYGRFGFVIGSLCSGSQSKNYCNAAFLSGFR